MSKSSVAGRASRADVLPNTSALDLDRAPEAKALRLVREAGVLMRHRERVSWMRNYSGSPTPARVSKFASHMV
ncbi:hypothetical protein CDV36_004363 [Fusarium kuroshium]|uniref:Uncharacterized protein n=1 Tax=Fusarium kuroshium TaxID=2010991 RepID=A0A3M2SEI2_9HYPO|nr:hypothetical protein CDV36_004363 [Fusarium kuroshium]